MKKIFPIIASLWLVTITVVVSSSILISHKQEDLSKHYLTGNLGLQPQFNIINLPDDDKWNNATLGMQPVDPGHYIAGETDTTWTMTIDKDFYTASFSVPNIDNFLNKYGENNYVTLKECVQAGMVNPDFKFGFLYHNSYGSSDIASIQLHESKYNFDTYMSTWANAPIDNTNSTFEWSKNIVTTELNPLLNLESFDIHLLLTLYDQNNNKISVYDAFQTALVPDGMDDMFSLKIKDGCYFKWTGQYQFHDPNDPTQNFENWTFQGTKTQVLDRLSSEPINQTYGEIVKPSWSSKLSRSEDYIAADMMYDGEGIGIIQRCELGKDTSQDNYTIKKVRLVDLIHGLRADESIVERDTMDAWLSRYIIKIDLTAYGDESMPIPWITRDDARHHWLNIPDFHCNIFSIEGFTGFINLYDNNNQLNYSFITNITSQLEA